MEVQDFKNKYTFSGIIRKFAKYWHREFKVIYSIKRIPVYMTFKYVEIAKIMTCHQLIL